MNNELQRISDNDYYQNLSYSIKSEVPISTWQDTVDSLAHPLDLEDFLIWLLNQIRNNIGFITDQSSNVDARLI